MPQTTLPEFVRLTGVILMLDVVESVRLMESDEQGYIRRWQRYVRDVREDVLPGFAGRIHKSTGDGLLMEFRGPDEAVQAAFGLLHASDAINRELPPEAHMRLRMAIHLAQFVADEYDIYGCGINLAHRLLQLARPGEVWISATMRHLLGDSPLALVVDCGMHQLRHVREPVHVYEIRSPDRGPRPHEAPLPACTPQVARATSEQAACGAG